MPKLLFTGATAGMVAALLAFSPSAHASDWNCSDAGSLPQQGMNYCAHQDYLAADAELNAVYKRVRAAVAKMDYGGRPDGKPEVDVLRDAQRAWIKFRDLACDMEGIHMRGGTMERLLVSACLEEKTRQRIKDLRYLIDVEGR